MGIDKVKVQNYKSIVDTDWVNLEDDITTLVGENEAGKTNFLEALRLIGTTHELENQYLCRRNDGSFSYDNKSGIEIVTIPLPLNNFCFDKYVDIIGFIISKSSSKKKINEYINISRRADGSYYMHLNESLINHDNSNIQYLVNNIMNEDRLATQYLDIDGKEIDKLFTDQEPKDIGGKMNVINQILSNFPEILKIRIYLILVSVDL